MSKISDNGKKKIGRISDSKILALDEEVLRLLYDNPDGQNITDRINKWLLSYIPYDFGHYGMDTSSPEHPIRRLKLIYEKWERVEPEIETHSITMPLSNNKSSGKKFDETIEQSYRDAIERARGKRPDIHEYHYHRIESRDNPMIAIGFFRYKDSLTNNAFTREEKNTFDLLAPHLILLFRAVLTQVYHSQAFQYFNAFANLGSKLAEDYSLSDSEVKLIPDILFGYNNEEIAEKNFISLDTVKSHIKHILKKTETKNRVDFISKFFTSPESVQL